MNAWVNITAENRIELRDVPEPVPGPGQLLVEIHAAGMNHSDLTRRSGSYKPGIGASDVTGGEGAGIVVALGPDCHRFSVGDRVMAMCSGSFASHCLFDDAVTMAIPPSLSFAEAAALPVGICTEHDALVTRGRLQEGQSVLVTGATGGVGPIGISIARLKGAKIVIGTTRSPERCDKVPGVDAMLVSGDDLANQVRELTGGIGADVIVDHVGGPIVQKLFDAAAIAGRIINVGRVAGKICEVNIDDLSRKRLSLIGVTFRTRSRDEYAEVTQAAATDLFEPIASGALRALIDHEIDFEDAPAGQDLLEHGGYVGKLVLRVAP